MAKARSTFFLKTFGCAQNVADSQRIRTFYLQKGYYEASSWQKADLVIINTCIVRESAENRVYGLIDNIHKFRLKTNKRKPEIILTGCLVGLATNDKTGKRLKALKARVPQVNKLLPIDQISFAIAPLRNRRQAALIPISTGCNNFCSYCIVPYTRGREISRPFAQILTEANDALSSGFSELVLVGQNVNSYGSDLIAQQTNQTQDPSESQKILSMGKTRSPSLFPKLLAHVARLPGLTKVAFVSSNPWDFSDELISVIAQNKTIDRVLHLPVQSGDDRILQQMNRAYTARDYLHLVKKIRKSVPDVQLTTDLIVGFPGETENAFQNTVKLCQQVGFTKAYINKYSPRPGTPAFRLPNTISQTEKRRRWQVLDWLINSKVALNQHAVVVK